jgi:hypothetical protein
MAQSCPLVSKRLDAYEPISVCLVRGGVGCPVVLPRAADDKRTVVDYSYGDGLNCDFAYAYSSDLNMFVRSSTTFQALRYMRWTMWEGHVRGRFSLRSVSQLRLRPGLSL